MSKLYPTQKLKMRSKKQAKFQKNKYNYKEMRLHNKRINESKFAKHNKINFL